MQFRLLIDLEALSFINGLLSRLRRGVWDHIRQIQKFPGNYSNYIWSDPNGRRLDVSVFGTLQIFYWIDVADRHIKILSICPK